MGNIVGGSRGIKIVNERIAFLIVMSFVQSAMAL